MWIAEASICQKPIGARADDALIDDAIIETRLLLMELGLGGLTVFRQQRKLRSCECFYRSIHESDGIGRLIDARKSNDDADNSFGVEVARASSSDIA